MRGGCGECTDRSMDLDDVTVEVGEDRVGRCPGDDGDVECVDAVDELLLHFILRLVGSPFEETLIASPPPALDTGDLLSDEPEESSEGRRLHKAVDGLHRHGESGWRRGALRLYTRSIVSSSVLSRHGMGQSVVRSPESETVTPKRGTSMVRTPVR